MENSFNSKAGWLRMATLISALIVSMVLTGCASTGGNYGHLQRDREIDNTYYAYKVLPDHRYYTSGGYDLPNAILAIHKDYELVTDLWQSIPNVNSAQIRKWIETISPKENYRKSRGYFGAYIIDPTNGNKAGVWYSVQDTTVIKFLGENKLQVYTPDLFQPGELSGDGGSGVHIKFK